MFNRSSTISRFHSGSLQLTLTINTRWFLTVFLGDCEEADGVRSVGMGEYSEHMVSEW